MDDLISRQKAINAIENTECELMTSEWNDLVNSIKSVPSAQKKGHWIISECDEYELAYGGMIYVPNYKCSCCDRITESYVRRYEPLMPNDADFPAFCPKCGADMREEEE